MSFNKNQFWRSVHSSKNCMRTWQPRREEPSRERTVREATDDIHIRYSKMTSELETKIGQHTEMSELNAEALRTDLQQQAERLESELHDKEQHQTQVP